MAPVGARMPPGLVQFVKYGAASAVALAVDYGVLIALTEVGGLHYLFSAAIAFTCGAAVAYAISVSVVFDQRRLADRRLEFAVFALLGLAGLVASQLIMWVAVDRLGVHYASAKLLAVAVSFLLNFGLRRAFLFTPAGVAAA